MFASFPFVPVHPKKLYPAFSGLINVNVGVKTLYVAGFSCLSPSGFVPSTNGICPPAKSYVIE